VVAPLLLVVGCLLHLNNLVHADVTLGEDVRETVVVKAAKLENLT
jgi:hypothetical protein